MRIYAASSWRNQQYPSVVYLLREAGHQVYDFRYPHYHEACKGFSWDQAGLPTDQHGTVPPSEYLQGFHSDIAIAGFNRDWIQLQVSDAVVLVLPCERDAHLELGWACGAGKHTAILLDDPCKPSLMYHMVDLVTADTQELVDWLEKP